MAPRRAVQAALIFNLLLAGVALAMGLTKTGNPSRYFGEGRFTMAFSCLQLLAVAFFALRTCFARRPVAPKVGFLSGSWVWAAVAAGFVFLAADEAFQFHEKFDKVIHKVLHLRPTPLTDHIDDAIIGFYGLLGLGVLWLFRKELLNFRVMLKPMVGGFLCLLGSVLCDAISNGEQFLLWITGDLEITKWLDGWLSVGDGAFTLFAEGLFVAAFYLGYRAACESRRSADPENLPKISGSPAS